MSWASPRHGHRWCSTMTSARNGFLVVRHPASAKFTFSSTRSTTRSVLLEGNSKITRWALSLFHQPSLIIPSTIANNNHWTTLIPQFSKDSINLIQYDQTLSLLLISSKFFRFLLFAELGSYQNKLFHYYYGIRPLAATQPCRKAPFPARFWAHVG